MDIDSALYKAMLDANEMNYKVAKVEQLSMYMDLFDSEEELNFQNLISGY